ncbi:MAG: NAD(P)/FAD-dependent oxidoreductase [Methylophilaceae bacterium]
MIAQTMLAPSFYEASLPQPRIAYPTLNSDVICDVCIAGGGFMGLHTALNLQEQGLKVVLLEAERIGYGASGRNGGHVIPEFGGSQCNFEKHLDMDSAKRVWQISHMAADSLRARIAKYHIACDYQRGHIEVAITPKHERQLKDWQAHIAKHYSYKNQWISQQEVSQYVGSKRYIAGVLDNNGGHLHPLKLALGLAAALKQGGAEIYEHSAVNSWISEGDKLRIITAMGEVTCRNLVLGCNVGIESLHTAAAQKLAKRILPVGSWVIATEPLSKEEANELLPNRAAVVDMRFILDYFRLSADNRMIFGGGCSYTGKEAPTNLITLMCDKMLKVFPQLATKKIDFGWGGLIDISMNRMPDFGFAGNKNVLYAQGFSGSGVVATNAAAQMISEAILGNTQNLAMFQRISHTSFRGGRWLRGPVTAIGMLYHRALDLF